MEELPELTIVVRQEGHEDAHFSLKPTDSMEKLMQGYRAHCALPDHDEDEPILFVFRVNGMLVCGSDTPALLKLRDGDVIVATLEGRRRMLLRSRAREHRADRIIRGRILRAAPPPSLPALPPEVLGELSETLLTNEALHLSTLSFGMRAALSEPSIYRHLTVTPDTHSTWRKAGKETMDALKRDKLCRLRTANIMTGHDVYESRLRRREKAAGSTHDERPCEIDYEEMGIDPDSDDDASDYPFAQYNRALRRRAKYASILEASRASLREISLQDEVYFPIKDRPADVAVADDDQFCSFDKTERVVIAGVLWDGCAYARRWRFPALKSFSVCDDESRITSLAISDLDHRYIESWVSGCSLAYLDVPNLEAPSMLRVLRSLSSVRQLTAFGVLEMGDPVEVTEVGEWLEEQGVGGGKGRVEAVLCRFNIEPSLYLANASALSGLIGRVAGEGISPDPADAIVAILPPNPSHGDPNDPPPSQPRNRYPIAQHLFEVPAGDPIAHDTPHLFDRSHSRGVKKRPFTVALDRPEFVDDMLRVDWRRSDALGLRIAQELARHSRRLDITPVGEGDVARDVMQKGTFGGFVFESVTSLTITGQHEGGTEYILPAMPPLPSSPAPSCPSPSPSARFPRIHELHLFCPVEHMLSDQGGLQPILHEVRGRIRSLHVTQRDVLAHAADANWHGLPVALASVMLRCLKAVHSPALESLEHSFEAMDALEHSPFYLPFYRRSPIYQLYMTPSLVAELPPIPSLKLEMPYSVFDSSGKIQLDLILAVVSKTPGLRRVEFIEKRLVTWTSPEGYLAIGPSKDRYPSYLATTAVDEALAAAGSPFVVSPGVQPEWSLVLER
ncbi:unnamed protein product [Vitrella brassicaformis CCMP3155]|uniref:Uncharacterized protein n=1 Tax=Vitrella brassicaformis (strain CCMP3155) TaxID=1169540 RepID=A0A0G4GR46_VITBC|nr:unnamed protein product [Vitrella brassicaformis CCMP3155]|eukprot:CEM33002.1 unnamed protein product [Vitrella brassicaformis CCMP3155]